MQGTFTVNAIINLHLALGQIGKPGCGPFSLTGQPNAMGGRDVGYMSHTLPGQRFINNAQHRADRVGMDELAEEKLSPLLKLKYNNAIADAVADLGKPEEIWTVFTSFQQYLYRQAMP